MADPTNPYAVLDDPAAPRGHAATVRGIGTDTIELELEVTVLDHEALVEHYLRSPAFVKSVRQAQRRVVVSSVPLLLAIGLASLTGFGSTSAAVLVGLGGAVAATITLAIPIGRRGDVRRGYGKQRLGATAWRVLGPRRVRCTPTRFEWWSPWNDVRVSWAAVDEIETGIAAAYVTAPYPHCDIVPRHVFANDAEFDSFVALAREYQARAGSV